MPFLTPHQNQVLTQQQPTESVPTKNVKVVFSNWFESESLLKRKRNDTDDHAEQATNEMVWSFCPKRQKTWHLGDSGKIPFATGIMLMMSFLFF